MKYEWDFSPIWRNYRLLPEGPAIGYLPPLVHFFWFF